MTYYAARNPYRNSTGGLNLPPSPPRTQIIVPVRPPSPADSNCSSCDDSSLPLNTPWSGTPTSSQQQLQTERICTRTTRRRLSTHSEGRSGHFERHSGHSEGRPASLVIRQGQHISGGPLSAPPRERQMYHSDRSSRTLIVPASSSERHRRSASTTSRGSYSKYHHGIEHFDEDFNDGSSEVRRRGRTRFPRKLVSREAVEELGLPWTEEHDGAVVVLRALDRSEIERLVDLTEEIRRESTVFLTFLTLS